MIKRIKDFIYVLFKNESSWEYKKYILWRIIFREREDFWNYK